MKETRVGFLSGELLLEGILATPQGAGPFPAVIVCHPHPLYGGSMDNNVINGLFEALAQASFVSLKFNFRGVGQSQGEFDQGIGEQTDAAAAISFLSELKEVYGNRIGFAGYSAGAGFALPVGSNDARIKALAAVSPPLDMFDFGLLKGCPKPKFLISGDRDDLVSSAQFLEFCGNLPEPKECQTVEGADHLWWGYESSLAAKVTAFFVKAL
jgi:alpha/beta superfamily hydrolase